MVMSRIIKSMAKISCPYAYAIITFFLAILPEKLFLINQVSDLIKKFYTTVSEEAISIETVVICKIVLCLFLLVLVNVIYGCWKILRRKVVLEDSNYSISIEYGDILKIKGGQKVINFEECFTTTVGEKTWEIKKSSICGQYLQKYGPIDIKKLIENAGVKPAKGYSRFNKQIRYEPGTIVPNGEFLLLAFARLDQEGRGCLTYEEYIKCLDRLWDQIDIYRDTNDVYIPILGSHITRFDVELNQQQILDIMINSYRLSRKKIKNPEKLHIICRKKEGFSINNVFGIM